MDRKKRVVIADIHSKNENGKCTGHFFFFAENYKNALEKDYNVVVAGGPVYKQRFSDDCLLDLPFDYIVGKSKLFNTIRSLCNAFVLFRKVESGDIVVMQQARPVTSFVGILLFCNSKCSLFSVQYSKHFLSKKIFRLIYNLTKKYISGILCPNDEVGKAYDLPYLVIPDYIYVDKMYDDCNVSYEDKEFDFCVVGRLNKDKGIIEVAKYFRNKKYKLLIAGNVEDISYGDEIIHVCKDCNNIILKIGYLNDKEYNSYIRRSRYSILNYQSEYSQRSSGVVYDFIFNNVPIIGRKCGAFDFVCRNNLGSVYEDMNSYDWASLFDATIYGYYLESIRKYKLTHIQVIYNLEKFLEKKESL